MKTTLMVTAMMTLAAAASAQVMVHEHGANEAREQQLQILTERAATTGAYVSVQTHPVIGAPYTGEATTETIQVLADGNRIVRRASAKVYRDGQGRTRRETLDAVGQVTSVLISDPVRGTSIVFEPGSNAAHRAGIATFVTVADGHGEAVTVTGTGTGTSFHVSSDADLKAPQHAEQKAAQHMIVAGQGAGVTSVGPVTWVTEYASTAAASTREDLGVQVIEGVPAKGTRTTAVIPAGAIGNELPITVLSEEWVSVDLKVLVLTKHVDPRAGETTYRITGITRGEPNASLFELPAGVVVK